MPQYTFGGTPGDVLTDDAGNVIPDYPLVVRVAGTGATVTALFEADGTTPIGTLRSNAANTAAPGAVRTFKAADVTEIEYEYLDTAGQPVRWYQAGREVASDARDTAQQALAQVDTKLDTATEDPQTVTGPVTFDGSVTFDAPITAPNLNDQSAARWFYVTGTVGNGVSDDRAKIQTQLDAARDVGGGIVVIPPGRTYGVGTFLTVYDNTTIWAHGATLKAIGNSGILRNFRSDETFSGYAGHSHILVAGGTWDGNAADGTAGTVTSETDILNFVHCSDVTVRDAVIKNCSTAHALEFNSCDGGRAINCQFLGFKDNSSGGTRGFSEAVQVDMAKSGSSSIGAFDNTASRNIMVSGCYFGPSERLGPYGRAVGSHTLTAGVCYDNVQIIGNRVDGTLQDGIYAYGWRRSVIANNVITGTGMSGIRGAIPDPATTAVSPHSLAITGNTVEGAATDSGIRVVGAPSYRWPLVSIADNVIRSITGNAIHVEYCAAPSVSGNDADTTTSTGLYAHYSDGAKISGNTVRAAGSNGVNIAGSVGALVSGNLIDTTTSNFGIFVGQGTDGTNGTDATVVGNTVTAAASAGIRCSTNAARCTVIGNKVRKGSGTTANGLSLAASATDCAILTNDLSGNGWSATAALSVSTAAPITGPGGMTALPGSNIADTDLTPLPALEAAMRPAGRYETTSRLRLGTSSTPTSGTLYLVPIWLPRGLTISSVTFVSGGTAAASPTNYWFTVHDSARKALARTADQLTAAWTANTAKTLALAQTLAGSATSYVTTYSGLHYLGVMIKATTVPNLVSEGSLPDVVAIDNPGFGGTNAGQSTPPTVTGGAFTASTFGGSGILAYGYVS